mmetsp:Transcript_16509/g.38703  ORF Transcript_16509/g.38703 Transcript_16509/m.38703 type:complete len:361 (+) Transcript_16509:78-1160(+)
MAMPTNFWRNEQMLNIFRTKPCQRLARDGVCRWRSQCQYSHCPEWPRRQPRKYAYSPEICPQLREAGGCPAGLNCSKAHSKDEVLFHPHFFKTQLCKEHASHAVQRGSRSTRGSKRHRCHRYYCPFAHGQEELRSSPLTEEQRSQCLLALEFFPSDDCCTACTRYWLPPYHRAEERCPPCSPVLDLEADLALPPWPPVPQAPQPPLAVAQLWGLLGPGTQPTLALREPWSEAFGDLQQERDTAKKDALHKKATAYPLASAHKPMAITDSSAQIQEKDALHKRALPAYPLTSAFKPMAISDAQIQEEVGPLASDSWSDMMPAFIDLGPGSSASLEPPMEKFRAASAARQRELLGQVVYAML